MKGPEAFRTISEAATELGVPQHVLRFWETKFSFIRPMKRAGGRRFYRRQDIEVLRGVRTLLHHDGYTIKGVQRLHKEHGVRRLLEAAASLGSGEGGTSSRIEDLLSDDIELNDAAMETNGVSVDEDEIDDLFEVGEASSAEKPVTAYSGASKSPASAFAAHPEPQQGQSEPTPRPVQTAAQPTLRRTILNAGARARLTEVLGDLDATKARLDQLLVGDDS